MALGSADAFIDERSAETSAAIVGEYGHASYAEMWDAVRFLREGLPIERGDGDELTAVGLGCSDSEMERSRRIVTRVDARFGWLIGA